MTTSAPPTDVLHSALAIVAPGTPLRDGIERIVRAKMAALLILDDGPEVLAICSGGVLPDAPVSPPRPNQPAQMDGPVSPHPGPQRLSGAHRDLPPEPPVPPSPRRARPRP